MDWCAQSRIWIWQTAQQICLITTSQQIIHMSINTAIPKKISRVVPFPGAAAAAEVSGAHNTEANMIVENENDETMRQWDSFHPGILVIGYTVFSHILKYWNNILVSIRNMQCDQSTDKYCMPRVPGVFE